MESEGVRKLSVYYLGQRAFLKSSKTLGHGHESRGRDSYDKLSKERIEEH
jgi:hypothetical protein